MFAAIASLTTLGLVLGFLLGLAARYLKVEGNPLEAEIEAMLPGSQCGQCGYPGCTPAAAALVSGEAPATLCPPGGQSLALALADKLGITADLSAMEEKAPMVAFIKDDLCIGCTKCYKRCPTDAIVGASKQIHAVIGDACTSCEKCVDVCPTECIVMRPIPVTLQNWYWPKPAIAA
jgi:electron transport complex protein RnfB